MFIITYRVNETTLFEAFAEKVSAQQRLKELKKYLVKATLKKEG